MIAVILASVIAVQPQFVLTQTKMRLIGKHGDTTCYIYSKPNPNCEPTHAEIAIQAECTTSNHVPVRWNSTIELKAETVESSLQQLVKDINRMCGEWI